MSDSNQSKGLFVAVLLGVMIIGSGIAFAHFHESPLNFCEFRILPTGIISSDIPVEVSVRARNDSCTNDNPTWGSTLFRYSMDGVVYGNEICFDHQNHEGAFDATEYFTLEPELEKGVYLINASGYSTDDCSMTQRRQWGSILWLLPGAQAESAVISVWKWFNDDNPQAVTVHVDCDSGTPSADSLNLTNGQTTQFVVSNFESGFLNCTVSEDLPTGYIHHYKPTLVGTGSFSADEQGCHFSELTHGLQGLCLVENHVGGIEVVVEQQWLGGAADPPPEVEFTLECVANSDPGRTRRQTERLAGDGWTSFLISSPHWSGETCSIKEAESPDYKGEQNKFCSDIQVGPGYSSGNPDNPGEGVDWCVWNNTAEQMLADGFEDPA